MVDVGGGGGGYDIGRPRPDADECRRGGGEGGAIYGCGETLCAWGLTKDHGEDCTDESGLCVRRKTVWAGLNPHRRPYRAELLLFVLIVKLTLSWKGTEQTGDAYDCSLQI
jgi:hypothetical protein